MFFSLIRPYSRALYWNLINIKLLLFNTHWMSKWAAKLLFRISWNRNRGQSQKRTNLWKDNESYILNFVFVIIGLTDMQTSYASIWKYHCLGEVVFLKICNQYWLPPDTLQRSFCSWLFLPISKIGLQVLWTDSTIWERV